MSNIFVPAAIRDKATRDTFIAVVKELNNVKTVTTSLTDPNIYTPGKPGDVIFSESSNSIWVFSGTTWVLAADNTTTATVTLFNKTNIISAPALPTGSFTYTFSSSVLSGSGFNGWTQTPPSLNKGEYLWSIQAPAVSSLTTDTINANEFSAPAIIGIGGEDGLAGNFSDLQGSIAQTQIPSGIIDSTRLANDSVISSKISANAVGANAIAANVITGDKIVANTITGNLLNTTGIITSSAQMGTATVVTATIGNNQVTFPQAVQGSSSQIIAKTDTTNKTLATMTVSQTGAPAQIVAYFTVSHNNGTSTSQAEWISFNVSLKANGAVLAGLNDAKVGDINSPAIILSAQHIATGSITYTLEFSNTGNGAATNTIVIYPRIQFTELKK
jgi:hypothetical protein